MGKYIKLKLVNQPGNNWHYIRMGGKSITWHKDQDSRFIWYNLQYNPDRDIDIIEYLIRNRIPFEFKPNGSFPRLQVSDQYFYFHAPKPRIIVKSQRKIFL